MDGEFVRISGDRTNFEIGGRPWYFAGCNCYYLMTRAAEPNLRHEVTEVLDAAVSCGLSAIRTWAFCEGKEWNALQPSPGVFDENVFRGLDWVLAEARKRRLKVMLTLVNYWSAYGGMEQYVKWSQDRRGLPADTKADANSFYTDPQCQDVFRNFLATITSRVNTLTNTAYRDDSTIMAWGLANEARCVGDFSGSKLQDWAEATSEFMKSLDPNHLLTLGAEGFLGAMTPGLLPYNPYDSMNQGCDFMRNHTPSNIDFCTIHLWPDSWLPNASDDKKLEFSRQWIDCHINCCHDLGKPLVITEFGKKPAGPGRTLLYHQVYQWVMDHVQDAGGLSGTFFWSAVGVTFPDHDGYSVHLSKPKVSALGSRPTTANHDASSRRDLSDSRMIEKAAQSLEGEVREDTSGTTLPDQEVPDSAVGLPVKSEENTQDVCQKEGDNDAASGLRAKPEVDRDKETPLHSDSCWLDEDLVEVIKDHASQMAYLNGSWPCAIM